MVRSKPGINQGQEFNPGTVGRQTGNLENALLYQQSACDHSGYLPLDRIRCWTPEGLLFWDTERSKAGSASIFLDDFVSKTNISKLSLYVRHIFSSLS